MNDVIIDANVALRYLLRDNESLFKEAAAIMKLAQSGYVKLHLTLLTVAEIVWVLDSFYKYPKRQVADTISAFIGADGIVVEEIELIFQALNDYAEHNVDFIDACLAAKATANNWSVATFDMVHFKRLSAEIFSAKGRPARG